ncbi:MAG: hypothetical protein QMC79_10360 [Anaerosomatales bacterium]|nr:hypothetical protein [Anaerosomatales bacterium]
MLWILWESGVDGIGPLSCVALVAGLCIVWFVAARLLGRVRALWSTVGIALGLALVTGAAYLARGEPPMVDWIALPFAFGLLGGYSAVRRWESFRALLIWGLLAAGAAGLTCAVWVITVVNRFSPDMALMGVVFIAPACLALQTGYVCGMLSHQAGSRSVSIGVKRAGIALAVSAVPVSIVLTYLLGVVISALV